MDSVSLRRPLGSQRCPALPARLIRDMVFFSNTVVQSAAQKGTAFDPAMPQTPAKRHTLENKDEEAVGSRVLGMKLNLVRQSNAKHTNSGCALWWCQPSCLGFLPLFVLRKYRSDQQVNTGVSVRPSIIGHIDTL